MGRVFAPAACFRRIHTVGGAEAVHGFVPLHTSTRVALRPVERAAKFGWRISETARPRGSVHESEETGAKLGPPLRKMKRTAGLKVCQGSEAAGIYAACGAVSTARGRRTDGPPGASRPGIRQEGGVNLERARPRPDGPDGGAKSGREPTGSRGKSSSQPSNVPPSVGSTGLAKSPATGASLPGRWSPHRRGRRTHRPARPPRRSRTRSPRHLDLDPHVGVLPSPVPAGISRPMITFSLNRAGSRSCPRLRPP